MSQQGQTWSSEGRFKEEFWDKNKFLSKEREKSSEQNGAKMMKIG